MDCFHKHLSKITEQLLAYQISICSFHLIALLTYSLCKWLNFSTYLLHLDHYFRFTLFKPRTNSLYFKKSIIENISYELSCCCRLVCSFLLRCYYIISITVFTNFLLTYLLILNRFLLLLIAKYLFVFIYLLFKIIFLSLQNTIKMHLNFSYTN